MKGKGGQRTVNPIPLTAHRRRTTRLMSTAQRAKERNTGMATILVVDDEHHLVELVRDYLTRENYTVLTAGDGPTALALARVCSFGTRVAYSGSSWSRS